ncbi:hypothetical protein FRC07_012424 [Ceratobasidium sp. 392]|nr:hypothetical protein FRC07_012424 [Ceratobasidium sp. 392]
MAPTNDIVILLTYLSSLEERAKIIFEGIRSILAGFECNVLWYELPLPVTLSSGDVKELNE